MDTKDETPAGRMIQNRNRPKNNPPKRGQIKAKIFSSLFRISPEPPVRTDGIGNDQEGNKSATTIPGSSGYTSEDCSVSG